MNDATHLNDEGTRLCSETIKSDLALMESTRESAAQVLVLLRLRTPPANGKNVHIVISKPRGEGSDEFLYNEHCAPENFLGVEIIAEGYDVDPVGIFEYVQTIDMPDDFDSCNVGPEELAQLFDKFDAWTPRAARAQPLASANGPQWLLLDNLSRVLESIKFNADDRNHVREMATCGINAINTFATETTTADELAQAILAYRALQKVGRESARCADRTARQLERAERALRRAGFLDLGGEEWNPPNAGQ